MQIRHKTCKHNCTYSLMWYQEEQNQCVAMICIQDAKNKARCGYITVSTFIIVQHDGNIFLSLLWSQKPAMSGPTWLPPRTLDSPERAVPQMSHSAGSAIYRVPNKKGMSDFRPKYGPYDQNGGVGVGGGMANRYMATGPTGKEKKSCSDTDTSIGKGLQYYQKMLVLVSKGAPVCALSQYHVIC